MEKHYGDRFAGLILYGSQARGQAESGSDIDLLVLLQASFDYFQEIWNLAELLYPLQLESDRLISVKPAAVQDFQAGILQFYRLARREGIQLWTCRFSSRKLGPTRSGREESLRAAQLLYEAGHCDFAAARAYYAAFYAATAALLSKGME